MKFDIRYRMAFSYDEPVAEAHNEVRVKPRDDATQRVLWYRLASLPQARVLTSVDYWGTTVEHVGVRLPHDTQELVAEASVRTTHRAQPPGATLAGYGVTAHDGAPPPPSRAGEHLGDAAFRERHVEFLAPSEHTVTDVGIDEMAAACVAGVDEVSHQVEAVVNCVREVLAYEQGTTDIGISLAELVAGGVGVCQDFAHLSVAMLRSVGVPARYVSGYLFAAHESSLDDPPPPAADEPPDDDADGLGEVTVQTHAWVEAAIPGFGWWGVDPTNGTAVGERHVVIGFGRDYDDVMPLRGVYTGDANPQVDAEVVITRRAPGRLAAANETYVLPRRSNVLLSVVRSGEVGLGGPAPGLTPDTRSPDAGSPDTGSPDTGSPDAQSGSPRTAQQAAQQQ